MTTRPLTRLDLGASLEELEWTVNSYTLSFAELTMTAEALGDRIGRRRLFVIGVGGRCSGSGRGLAHRRASRPRCRGGWR